MRKTRTQYEACRRFVNGLFYRIDMLILKNLVNPVQGLWLSGFGFGDELTSEVAQNDGDFLSLLR